MLESSSLSQLGALSNPYCLNPLDPHQKARASDCSLPGYDSLARAYTAPYLMQSVDTRVVNRSNALQAWH